MERNRHNILKIILVALGLFLSFDSAAKDFGVVGHTYEIKEQDIVEYIKAQLKETDLVELEEKTKEAVRKRVNRPLPVENITKATENKSYYFDPTYVLNDNIYDHEGRLIHPIGTTINPLEKVPFRNALIFINGDDKEQVEFALKAYKDRDSRAKIVLINGSPIELQKEHRIWIYFDQSGVLTKKFGIEHVPAIVSQEKLKLKIEEVKL
ncbi:MAG: type-F conjugative transfer system protein TraW [Rickettsiales bacterium]